MERPSVHVVEPRRKGTIGRAHADLHRDDKRLSETPEPQIVA